MMQNDVVAWHAGLAAGGPARLHQWWLATWQAVLPSDRNADPLSRSFEIHNSIGDYCRPIRIIRVSVSIPSTQYKGGCSYPPHRQSICGNRSAGI